VQGRFYTVETHFYVQLKYTLILKCNIISPNKQVVNKERLRLTLTVIEVKTTLAQDCKTFNYTCSWYVIYPQPLKRNVHYCVNVLGLQK